jgi:hypothetical protein
VGVLYMEGIRGRWSGWREFGREAVQLASPSNGGLGGSGTRLGRARVCWSKAGRTVKGGAGLVPQWRPPMAFIAAGEGRQSTAMFLTTKRATQRQPSTSRPLEAMGAAHGRSSAMNGGGARQQRGRGLELGP